MGCCGSCGGENHEPVKNQDQVEETTEKNEEE
jgi:hypothetical protein